MGLKVRRSAQITDCAQHVSLIASSMERRSIRGERVPEDLPLLLSEALMRHHAGELFQAILDDQIIASALILRAADGAYYQSAGANAIGRECGAPTFLLFEIARLLQSEGLSVFNLGGAGSEERGLHEFKRGFGAQPVSLASARFFLRSATRRKVLTGLTLLRSDPKKLMQHISGRLERFVVYGCDPNSIPPPVMTEGAVVRKLTDDELEHLSSIYEFLRAHTERVHKFGFNDAYAVYYHGELAHISWLISAEHDRRIPTRNVKLREGEAEITNCVTLPQFRGLGLYPFAIRSLCAVARERGISRLFMISPINNLASQRGMQKAGLSPQGKIFRLAFSYLPEEAGLTFRGHRWSQSSK